jgi:hypothetical protein
MGGFDQRLIFRFGLRYTSLDPMTDMIGELSRQFLKGKVILGLHASRGLQSSLSMAELKPPIKR